MHHPRLAYVLLAGGGSVRFGRCKQLATLDFKTTLIEKSLATALEVSPGEVLLGGGAHRKEIVKH
ncbi:MAG: CTP:molybdopterin cytidylyltransferase MocA [Lentisphaeria bacterium]|jgi:CTP:molybdopterin cytidylyltransferase MocA